MVAQPIDAIAGVQGIISFSCDLALIDGGGIPVSILQSMVVADAAITGDTTRAHMVAALRDLLHGRDGAWTQPVVDELATGGTATVLLAPEYAFGSPDWAPVDDLVRAANRPLVLIAGFGMTPGTWLREWLGTEGATRRYAGWDTDREVRASDRVYNGLWCWIHSPGAGTSCVATLKNFPEQRTEASHRGLDRGRNIVRLSFSDVDVFPLVCADLLQEPDASGSSPRQRVARAIATGPGGRPVLVTGSLLQTRPWDWNWQHAIGSVVADAAPNRTVVMAIANQAYGRPRETEDEDKWRSLSGVYASKQVYPKGATPFPSGRPVSVGASAEGLVIRDCSPCVVGGPILVSRVGPVTGLHLWQAAACFPLDGEGIGEAFTPHACAVTYETHRLTRRHPGQDAYSPRVAQGLAVLRAHLEGRTSPDAGDILRSLLSGTEPAAEDITDDLHLSMPELEAAIHALAVLCTFDELVPHGRAGLDGQLRFRDADAHILVWKARKQIGTRMYRMLQAWTAQAGGHPPLVVVGSPSRGLPLRAGPVELDRRSDWTAPPPSNDAGGFGPGRPASRDITQPRVSRRATCIDLALLEEIYLDHDADLDAERIAGFLTHLLRDIIGGGG